MTLVNKSIIVLKKLAQISTYIPADLAMSGRQMAWRCVLKTVMVIVILFQPEHYAEQPKCVFHVSESKSYSSSGEYFILYVYK